MRGFRGNDSDSLGIRIKGVPQLVCRLAASQFDRGGRAVAEREDRVWCRARLCLERRVTFGSQPHTASKEEVVICEGRLAGKLAGRRRWSGSDQARETRTRLDGAIPKRCFSNDTEAPPNALAMPLLQA